MKFYYRILLVVIFALGIMLQVPQANAQSVLVVEWEETPGSDVPIVNALRTTIAEDTLRPADRVYQLKRGGFYWITDRISNADFPLVIIGEGPEAVPAGETDYGLAIIQRVAREDGSAPDGTMFEASHDLTLQNVWVMGQTDQGVTSSYEPIKLLGDGKRYVFDNVVFDRNDWHHLGPDGPNNKIYITNCDFRNLFGPTQQWEGLGIRLEVGADTVVIENTTFFNIGFCPFQSEAAPCEYLRFNHNTLVNVGRIFSAGTLWKECYVTNNVFVNYYWHGDSEDQYTDPDREDPYTGFFSIGDLPARFGTDFDRKVYFANNSFWRDSRFDDFHASFVPMIQSQPVINDSTAAWFARWDAMKMENNYLDVNPNLTTYPLDTPGLLDSMTTHLGNLYADPAVVPAGYYYWDPGRDPSPVMSIWPLPEDFSYSNSQLLTGATDGLPVGDLNYYPTSKADFEANKAAYIKEIEESVYARPLEVCEGIEAESGTLAGDAEIYKLEAFSYYEMDGSGYIEWTFDLDAEAQYDLKIWVNMRGNTQKGNHIYVNDVDIHDSVHGWGEYIFDDTSVPEFSSTEWFWHLITQSMINEAGALTMPAGTNIIKITPSWGWMSFAGFDILEAGTETVVKELRAPDAVFEGVRPMAEGAAWTPNYFKAVTLNAGGSFEVPIDAPYNTDYMVRVFYAAAGAATGEIAIDGAATATVAMADTGDAFCTQFVMTAGSHNLKFSSASGGVTVDYIQLIAFVPTSVKARQVLPEGYALSQNYPNPFNPSTNINFSVGKLSHVELTVYNILGQKVATLVNQRIPAGAYRVTWDASNMSSGLYFYTMKTDNLTVTRKMMMIK